MNLPHSYNTDRLRPSHVVMILIVMMTVAGGSLLLSASDAPVPVDGAIEWHEGSTLRAVVELLCLNYQLSTNYAGDVKNFILGIGACLALLALSIATIVQTTTAPPVSPSGEGATSTDAAGTSADSISSRKAHVAPLVAAQILAGVYLLWSFASSRWSSAPDLAVGASALLAISLLWSFAIGRGLSPLAGRLASQSIVVIAVATALVAIWYYYGRNPNLRAKFPFGNPTFLAAALIPGVLLGGSFAVGCFTQPNGSRRFVSVGLGIACVLGAAACLGAVYLTGARGATVGLVFGALASVYFAFRRRKRWIPGVAAIVLAVVGGFFFVRMDTAAQASDRVATAQLRRFAWDYAWQMFTERPLRGHGQGGFVLTGDSLAVDDVLDYPEVLEARIAHVHNEWLEVMADLGSIGIVLVVAMLILTLAAGDTALSRAPPGAGRWALVGLMGALVGLVAEESLGVGLRTGGLAVIFFTVIGLIWSLSSIDPTSVWSTARESAARRWIPGILGIVAALSCLALSRQDFSAARSSYQSDQSFFTDEFDETIRLSELATHRLNPQRVLTNLFRLSEAHLRAAEFLQTRARDRQRRAYEISPPATRLLALAEEDYRLSDMHCEEGNGWLKRLVERSPGFLNQGRLAQRFSMTRAYNAGIRGEPEQQLALVQHAEVSLAREIKRQPFDTSIAADLVKTRLAIGGAVSGLSDLFDVLARPLRRNRVSSDYVDVIGGLIQIPQFLTQLDPLVRDAQAMLTNDEERAIQWTNSWAPEKLRLAATIRFISRDYGAAAATLESIAPVYDQLAPTATFGCASFYAELADCRFYADPMHPSRAIAAAQRAFSLAPESLRGRKLLRSIQSRLIDYHIAGDNERTATQWLKATMPSNAGEEGVRRELGMRYARIGESLLDTCQKTEEDTEVPPDVANEVQRLAMRAVNLNPRDPQAHFAAANLLWRAGREQAAATNLRNALANGLSTEMALEFLDYALSMTPNCAPLKSIRSTIAQPSAATRPSGSDSSEMPARDDPNSEK